MHKFKNELPTNRNSYFTKTKNYDFILCIVNRLFCSSYPCFVNSYYLKT